MRRVDFVSWNRLENLAEMFLNTLHWDKIFEKDEVKRSQTQQLEFSMCSINSLCLAR